MDRSRIYKVRGKRWKGAMGLCLAAVLAMAVLTGCSRKTAAVSGARTVDKEYTKGQMMVIAITERNRYQNIYTSELWSVKADQNGDTFEDRLMDQVEQFLIELATTNLMADEQGIELTGREKMPLNPWPRNTTGICRNRTAGLWMYPRMRCTICTANTTVRISWWQS